MLANIAWWAVTALAIVGVVLNIHMRIEGFYLWIVADAALFGRNMYLGEYSQAILWAVYFCLAIMGVITWHRKQQKTTAKTTSRA